MSNLSSHFVFAARRSELSGTGCVRAQVEGHTLALFDYAGHIYAVDGRCPHMGFPLSQGSVKDGILTCHWHHARFDLASGGTFDLWADDARAFPVELRSDEVWVDLAMHGNPAQLLTQRLQVGLQRNISLVIAKAVIGLMGGAHADSPAGRSPEISTPGLDAANAPFQTGLAFGTTYRQGGWGQGLTMLACMMNLLPHVAPEDRPRALYHGLAAVAQDTDGNPPRFPVQALPAATTDIATLKRWFRQFIEVRDAEGAERCIVSAVRAGADQRQLADMLFAAVTDHRYIQVGHPLDFTNKALEALDIAGWPPALTEQALASLVNGFANADRMEESNAWRNPIDLVAILQRAFDSLENLQQAGALTPKPLENEARTALAMSLLGDDPQHIVDSLLGALRAGVSEVDLAGVVAYAAALRIARFHISNEFGDWDTALHTFTFANAVHQGMRRTPSPELLRGVFDAAMSIYLDRFLNVPAARLPAPDDKGKGSLVAMPALLDRQQQVDAAGEAIALQRFQGADAQQLIAMLGKLLLREDRNFHTIQMIEAAVRQHEMLAGTPEATHVLVAAARYLAAHAPTMRAQGQTYNIALRLARGERLFEEE